MQQVPLSNGGVALVDDDIFDAIKHWTWRRDVTGYPCRDTTLLGTKHHLRLHSLVMGCAPTGFVTDHINGDKLDNRRSNLRFCSKSLNALNGRKSGVSWHEGDQKWRIRFQFHGKELYYGNFDSKEEAKAIAALLKASLIYYELTKGETDGVR